MKRKILNGYWIVYVPDHPWCIHTRNYSGWEYEHRYIIEVELGRQLARDEVVHHKNGNKLDNRRENLELMNTSSHTKLHMDEARRGKVRENRCEVCGCLISRHAKRCRAHSQNDTLSLVDASQIADEVSEGTFTSVGKKYGVSGTAIRKKLLRSGMTREEVKCLRRHTVASRYQVS